MNRKLLTAVVFGACCLVGAGCAPLHDKEADRLSGKQAMGELTPAQAYAGEVLAYLMQVVLGTAGPPARRAEWASTTGHGIGLDYRAIAEVMADPSRNKSSLLVFDANILGISQVLYHYDPQLNQFKGVTDAQSIYPSSELVALRLLLARKIRSNEKIRLQALIEREGLLKDPAAVPTAADLTATHLNIDEWRLLSEAFQAEPRFFQYIRTDALVDALYRTGAVEADPFVVESLQRLAPPECYCRHFGGSENPAAVKLAILPSMTRDFDFGRFQDSRYPAGFRPTDFFLKMSGKLKESIFDATRELIRREAANRWPARIDDPQLPAAIDRLIFRRISFQIEDVRPLAVYPGNARRVLSAICPEADFTLVLLGKDVYLSIEFDDNTDQYPAVPRLYIDIMDVKRSQIDAEAEQVGRFILSAIGDDIEGMFADIEARGARMPHADPSAAGNRPLSRP